MNNLLLILILLLIVVIIIFLGKPLKEKFKVFDYTQFKTLEEADDKIFGKNLYSPYHARFDLNESNKKKQFVAEEDRTCTSQNVLYSRNMVLIGVKVINQV